MKWTRSGLLQRLISSNSDESPKALVLYQSATGLLVIALTLTAMCAIRIYRNQALDGGTVTVCLSVFGALAALAGWHSQTDPGAAIPGHTETRDTTTTTPEISSTESMTSTTKPVEGGAK